MTPATVRKYGALFKERILGSTGYVVANLWVLLRTPWFSIHITEILHGDEFVDLHDHDRSTLDLVLRGRLLETREDSEGFYPVREYHLAAGRRRPQQFVEFSPGSVMFTPATTMHRVVLFTDDAGKPLPAYFLSVWGPPGRQPGYLVRGNWVHRGSYTGGIRTDMQRRVEPR